MRNIKHWLIGIGAAYSMYKFLAICLSILFVLGELYWLWTAIQIGSFWMFICGIIPPFIVVTGTVGAWSLLFGVPDWVTGLFG